MIFVGTLYGIALLLAEIFFHLSDNTFPFALFGSSLKFPPSDEIFLNAR